MHYKIHVGINCFVFSNVEFCFRWLLYVLTFLRIPLFTVYLPFYI